jgi:hypothetical protein
MPTTGAINERLVRVVLLEVEMVVAALGAIELDPHRYG